MKEIFLLLIWLVISFTPILILFMGLGSLQDIGYRYAANKYIRKKSSAEYWQIIQKYLDQQNMSLEELSKKSKIDKSILLKMKNGVLEDISYKLLHKVAKTLKINTNALVFAVDMKDLEKVNPYLISDKGPFVNFINFIFGPMTSRYDDYKEKDMKLVEKNTVIEIEFKKIFDVDEYYLFYHSDSLYGKALILQGYLIRDVVNYLEVNDYFNDKKRTDGAYLIKISEECKINLMNNKFFNQKYFNLVNQAPRNISHIFNASFSREPIERDLCEIEEKPSTKFIRKSYLIITDGRTYKIKADELINCVEYLEGNENKKIQLIYQIKDEPYWNPPVITDEFKSMELSIDQKKRKITIGELNDIYYEYFADTEMFSNLLHDLEWNLRSIVTLSN